MDPREIDKEKRRWKFWNVFNSLSYIFGFRLWRGFILGHNYRSRTEEEPPLVAIDRLARMGIENSRPVRISDDKQIRSMLTLLKIVAAKDGDINEEKTAFVGEFIRNHISAQISQEEVDHYVDLFGEDDASQTNTKNACFLLKSRLNRTLAHQFIEALYKLAYMNEPNLAGRREVDLIGRYLSLSPMELRQATFAAIKENKEKESDI